MLRDSYSMPFSCELVNFRVHHAISIYYRRTSYSVNFYLWEPSGGRDRCRIPTEPWERWPKCSRRKLLYGWKWYAIRWWISFRKAVENSTTWCLVSVFVSVRDRMCKFSELFLPSTTGSRNPLVVKKLRANFWLPVTSVASGWYHIKKVSLTQIPKANLNFLGMPTCLKAWVS